VCWNPLDPDVISKEIQRMTKEEEVARLKEAFAAEDVFPGYLGNPLAWGLPLSKRYLKDLAQRKADAAKKSPAPRKSRKSSSS
jgi:hypothetical protein